MKDIRAIKGKFYLQRLIAEGEHEHQDFKYQITDARKIARSISAFANNSGGHLLIGVKDNGNIAGVRNEEDIYVVEQAAQRYCRPEQHLRFSAFKADDGAMVIKAEIEAAQRRPVMVMEPQGKWKAYYRVGDENIVAHPIMVKAWQAKASGTPALLSLCEADRRLLDLIASQGYSEIDTVPRTCMVSQAAATDLLTRLYSIAVIDFRFIHRRFVIVASDPSCQ